jgi:carbon monoxide dehydrogenase subunit G
MPFRFTETVRVASPAPVVWDAISDFPNVPRWEGGVVEVRQTSVGPVGFGSTFIARRIYGGREASVACRIIDWVDGTSATMELVGGPLARATARYSVAPAGADACLVTYTGEGDLRGPLALFTPLVAPMGRRQIRSNVRRLEQCITDGTLPGGGHDPSA